MRQTILILTTAFMLLVVTEGVQAGIWFSEWKCDVYVTPVPAVEETVYVFQAIYHDSTGEPIQYFSSPTKITDSRGGKDEVNGNIAVHSVRDEIGKTHLVFMGNESGRWEIYYSLLDLDGNIVIPSWPVSDIDIFHSAYPSIAIDSNGDAHIVWMDERDGDWEIYYSKVRPDTLAGQAQDLTTPDVAISAIDGLASGRWCDPDNEWEVVAESETGNPIVAVHTNFPEHPDIVVDPSDTVHVVWSDRRTGNWKIFYQAQSTDSIPTVYFDDIPVSSPTIPLDEIYPAIAIGPRVKRYYPYDWGVHIAWQRDVYGEWMIRYRKHHSSVPLAEPLMYDQIGYEDTYHSAAPTIAVDDSDMAHIAFMDNRSIDPGHGDPLYYWRNDIHIEGYWEVYIAVLNTAGIDEIDYFRTPKRESDLSGCYSDTCDSAWMEQWGDPVYGYYTGPGSCENRHDAPSMFPRISTQGDFFDGTSKLVWQDIRNYNWDIYFEEISNWCSSPIPDVRITTYDGPDKFPEINVSQTGHRDVQWQRLMPASNRWDIWDSRWGGRGQFEEYVKVHISGPGRQTLSYYMYQGDHTDTNAIDGIVYCWVRPEPLFGYTTYKFSAQNYLGQYTETEERTLPTGRTDVEKVEPGLPGRFILEQNYPNPFNPTTTLRYQMPEFSHITLKIYDPVGREVRTLVDEPQRPGLYTVPWDGRDNRGENVASGIYFYRLQAGGYEMTRRMVLLR